MGLEVPLQWPYLDTSLLARRYQGSPGGTCLQPGQGHDMREASSPLCTMRNQLQHVPVWVSVLGKGRKLKGNFPAVRARVWHEEGLCIRGSCQAARAHAYAQAHFQQPKHMVSAWQQGRDRLFSSN